MPTDPEDMDATTTPDDPTADLAPGEAVADPTTEDRAPDAAAEQVAETATEDAPKAAADDVTEEAATEEGAEEAPSNGCPACGEPAPSGAKYCESCGADLAAPPSEAMAAAPCVSCGAPPQDIIEGGYCSNCGQKQPARRDHLEVDDGPVAAVTDRGKRHRRNEDAAAVWSGPDRAVVVVCDGVSSTDRPDEASQAAADTACDHLSTYLTSERGISSSAITSSVISSSAPTSSSDGSGGAAADAAPEPPDHDALEEELIAAIAAAHAAVAAVVADDPNAEPPSCTIVASVVHWTPEPSVSVAWIGDSRGYWIHADGSVEQVTSDHSWANLQRQLGQLDEAAIAADSRAHSITRWLGADAIDIEPDIVHLRPAAGGRWLACSDGLWNYADSNEAMAERIAEFDGSPLELAQRLTAFANDAGGHDNITVAVASTPKANRDEEQ